MSVLIKDKTTGEWTQVAGNGKAEYGASTVRKGTITIPENTTTPFESVMVTFLTPMPDADYIVNLEIPGDSGNWHQKSIFVSTLNKTKNGFMLYVGTTDNALYAGTTVNYTAFKLYTDTEYNSLLEDVAKLTGVTGGTGVRNTVYVSSENFIANWYKVGRICTVDIQYTLSQFTQSDIEIITGLPKPIVQIACVGEGNNNTNVSDFVIKTNGAVRTHYNGAEGQFMHGTATYITAE